MGIVENAKEIADLIKKYDNIELYRKIVELEGDIIELTRQIRSLEEKNEELEKKLSLSKKMKYKKPFYFQGGDEAPFCPLCYEREEKPIHLLGPEKWDDKQRYNCPSCNKIFLEKAIDTFVVD